VIPPRRPQPPLGDAIRRAHPTIDSPLGDLIAGKIDQAEYRRRMNVKRFLERYSDGSWTGPQSPNFEPRDADPLSVRGFMTNVEPEPLDVRIPSSKPWHLVPDSPRRGCSVLGWLVVGALVLAVWR
jgi:hypothetical protein